MRLPQTIGELKPGNGISVFHLIPWPVVLSQAVCDLLDEAGRSQLQPLGLHSLKGKAEPMAVYGVRD